MRKRKGESMLLYKEETEPGGGFSSNTVGTACAAGRFRREEAEGIGYLGNWRVMSRRGDG